ncbi:iron uptake porin [Thermoleptolyngbya oregonensis NK1-22]|uniref:Iron uptake porin n=1 Tax=Thermoleptolyngbya oregonensis NK1-22 TaxID=2547457 RepID=A0AA96Y864_9CYAN|nr:iron uptake porin [Thermoleptolyngbya oregonensis]WOB42908.1 iron uptake porin [Thermoleptolyngbya oregonensis NK1-22]
MHLPFPKTLPALKFSGLLLATIGLVAQPKGAIAQSALLEGDPMAQVTSVSEFVDVSPGDWAYEALAYLANSEQQGGLDCLEGYPDGSFRGRQALTRYEFAAGLASCLDAVVGRLENLDPEALARIEALQREFARELADLRGRVDLLEDRTAELEANQFSTTTRLAGEGIFDINDLFGDQLEAVGNTTVFQYRARLNFQTSFSGDDLLQTRLTAGNRTPRTVVSSLGRPNLVPNVVPRGTAEGLLITALGGDTRNNVQVDRLTYGFNLGQRLSAYVAAIGGTHQAYVHSTLSPFFNDADGGNGSLSPFSQYSPIYRIGGGTGFGFNYRFDDEGTLALSLGYLADNAANPGEDSGFFNGDYAALGQLTFAPSQDFNIGLTYVHGYHTEVATSGISTPNAIFDLGLGSSRFFTGTVPANALHGALGVPAVTNSYGLELSWRISSGISLSAFGGYTNLTLLETGRGDIWYYGLGLAFPDLFGAGNLGGIMVGVEPYLTGLRGQYTLASLGLENDTSLHIEAFYRIRVTDNISITPGVIVVTAPEQNRDLFDAFVIGTLRTTFQF